MYVNPYYESCLNELEHFGVKGMKWGVRRYQNSDGTLTEAGKKRYGTTENFNAAREKSAAQKQKIVKVAKTTAKVAAAGALATVSLSALLKGNRAGAVNIGGEALGQLISAGVLDQKTAASLVTSDLMRNGVRSLGMALWNHPGNTAYKPGYDDDPRMQELLKVVLQEELRRK